MNGTSEKEQTPNVVAALLSIWCLLMAWNIVASFIWRPDVDCAGGRPFTLSMAPVLLVATVVVVYGLVCLWMLYKNQPKEVGIFGKLVATAIAQLYQQAPKLTTITLVLLVIFLWNHYGRFGYYRHGNTRGYTRIHDKLLGSWTTRDFDTSDCESGPE